MCYVHNAVTLLASLQSFHDNCSFYVRNANKVWEILSEGGGKAADILYSDLEINVSSPTATFLIAFRSAPLHQQVNCSSDRIKTFSHYTHKCAPP
jgi:hypothetical protein